MLIVFQDYHHPHSKEEIYLGFNNAKIYNL